MDPKRLNLYREELSVDPRRNRKTLPQNVPSGKGVMISFPRTEAGKWLSDTFKKYCKEQQLPESALGRTALLEFLEARGVA